MTDLRRRHCHLVYGLAIDSDFELRGLPAAPPDSMAPRVRITRASIREPSLAQRDPSIFVNTGSTQLLAWAMVGAFRIASDDVIEVDPNPEASDALVALPLLGAVLATLLHRRGVVVFHASAISVHGRAVALLGDKGAGKSTTAGMLAAAGHHLIADDIVALDYSRGESPLVLPSYGELKLWPDSGARLGAAGLTKVRPIHDQIDKAHYALPAAAEGPVGLERLYVLQRSGRPQARVMPAADGVAHLLRHAYLARFGDAGFGAHMQVYFERSARLARDGLVRVLEVPEGLDRLDEIPSLIERDLEARRPAMA